jgi:hypothetical protein
MNRDVWLFLALLPVSSALYAETLGCPASSPHLPGSIIQLSKAAGVPDPDASYSLNLKAAGSTREDIPVSWSPKSSGGNLAFQIPPSADGLYTIEGLKKTSIKDGKSASEDLASNSPTQILVAQPAITAVSPNAAFGDSKGSHSFTILLSGLCSDNAAKPTSDVRFRFTEVKTPDFQPSCNEGQTQPCYGLSVDNAQQVTLILRNLDAGTDYYSGKKSFVLTVDGTDTAPAALTLINTTAGTPTTIAFAGFALILLVIYLLLRSGRKGMSQKMNGKTYWLSTLFFDQQTNSYSLSKCQFYAWTAASILAYLYLAASKSYVQGSAVFPDIPSGLPGILLASVGTVVLSTGITSAKGDKGAGAPGPNLSDFIASGGVVAADRLQFAWTLVGIGTFLAIVFQSDPRNITDLPAIPTGFMQLMGISTAGYLGGKLARKAGPTISAIVLTTSDKGNPRFQITGSGLSRSASFSIDGQPIFPDIILGKDEQPGLPEIVQLDPTVGDPDFARVLMFSLVPKDFKAAWLGKDRMFTVTNPDSQKAAWCYQKFAETTIAVTPRGADPVLTITGVNLDSHLTVTADRLPGAAGPANSPFRVDRTNPETDAANFVGTIRQRGGAPTGLAAGDKLNVTVKDDAGFAWTWEVTVQ